jgi:hypothetical protein
MPPFGFSGEFIFTIFPLLILGVFIFIAFKMIKQWSYNNSQPVLTVRAKVVSKRTNISHSTNFDENNFAHDNSSTSYYSTFEVDSGDRMELLVGGREYGMLAEGDTGNLTFQGTRYLGFNQQI